jgi:hypothetical protein
MAIDGTCEKDTPPILKLKDGHEIACHMTLEQLQEAERDTQKILHGYEKLGDDEQISTAH